MNDISSPLITLVDNVFQQTFREGAGAIYSPRTGQAVQRGTGYAVSTADPVFISLNAPEGTVFTRIVEYVSDNFTAEWATEEPNYLLAAADPETGVLAFTKMIIINDLAEAARVSAAHDFWSILDIGTGQIYIIEQPSPAAVAFQSEFLDQLAAWVGQPVGVEPVGPVLHDQPSLDYNPWNTPYIRSHIA